MKLTTLNLFCIFLGILLHPVDIHSQDSIIFYTAIPVDNIREMTISEVKKLEEPLTSNQVCRGRNEDRFLRCQEAVKIDFCRQNNIKLVSKSVGRIKVYGVTHLGYEQPTLACECPTKPIGIHLADARGYTGQADVMYIEPSPFYVKKTELAQLKEKIVDNVDNLNYYKDKLVENDLYHKYKDKLATKIKEQTTSDVKGKGKANVDDESTKGYDTSDTEADDDVLGVNPFASKKKEPVRVESNINPFAASAMKTQPKTKHSWFPIKRSPENKLSTSGLPTNKKSQGKNNSDDNSWVTLNYSPENELSRNESPQKDSFDNYSWSPENKLSTNGSPQRESFSNYSWTPANRSPETKSSWSGFPNERSQRDSFADNSWVDLNYSPENKLSRGGFTNGRSQKMSFDNPFFRDASNKNGDESAEQKKRSYFHQKVHNFKEKIIPK